MKDEAAKPGNPEDRRGRGPGARLKAAREARGLNLDEAARALAISPSLVAALESDDFARLGASVYARGYLRKYAAFLELPADELVGEYESLAVPRDPRVRARAVNTLPRRRNTHWIAPAFGAVAIAILIVVGLWLWRSGIIHGSSANPPAAAVSAAMAMTSPLPMHSEAVGAAPPPVRTAETGSGAAAAGASSRLELKLAVSSWVEVYDAHGQRLYYDLASAGQILDFQSSALPFRIFLGNAAGVSVELNGKPVRVPATGTSGAGARFQVPAATASAASPASVSAPGAAT